MSIDRFTVRLAVSFPTMRCAASQQRRSRSIASRSTKPIAGILYNELCLSTCGFRRLQVARSAAERAVAARALADEALDMLWPDVRVYPNFVWSHCRVCEYQRPRAAIESGADASAILAAEYGDRSEPRRLGRATWSLSRGAAPWPRGH